MKEKKLNKLFSGCDFSVSAEYLNYYAHTRRTIKAKYLRLLKIAIKTKRPHKLARLETKAEQMKATNLLFYIDKKLQLYYLKHNQF